MGTSLFEQRSQVAWVLRVGAHLDLALLRRRRGPTPGDLALGAAALVGDEVFRRWLVRDPRPHLLLRAAIDTVEAAVWSRVAGPSEARGRWVQIANVAVPGVEAGYRLGAGTRAVPGPVPLRRWPPERSDLPRVVGELALGVGLPFATVRLTRARRGWSWSWFEDLWAPLSVVSLAALARYRNRLHQEARSAWEERARDQIAVGEEASAASAAIRSSPGHDFKKNLTALGWAGSERARQAAFEQVDHPERVVTAASGTTLLRAAMGIPLVPAGSSDVWISAGQRAVLDTFIDMVDATLEDRDPTPLLEVIEAEGLDIRLRYRGHGLRLSNPPPRLEAALDPVVATLLVGAMWKVLASIHPQVRVPSRIALPAALLDVANAVVYARARADRRRGRMKAAAGLSLAGATIFDLGVMWARLPAAGADGEHVIPATGSTMGVLGVLGTCRDQLPRGWRGMLAIAVVGEWLATSLLGYRRPPAALLREAVALWQSYAASSGMVSAITAEAHHLETDLQAEFQRRVREASAAAEGHEVDRFEAQVTLAEQELAGVRDHLDIELVDFIGDQCQDLRRWIGERKAEARPAS